MDELNFLRSLVTVVSMGAFLGIVGWAWSRRNRARFEEASMLPFAEENNEPREARQ